MAILRRYFGILLLLLSPLLVWILVDGAIRNIHPNGGKAINDPLIWIIIIAIFIPIAIGLLIFGWYAFRGEYDQNPERSSDLTE